MYIVNENEKEYRFGDSGPKYLMKDERAAHELCSCAVYARPGF